MVWMFKSGGVTGQEASCYSWKERNMSGEFKTIKSSAGKKSDLALSIARNILEIFLIEEFLGEWDLSIKKHRSSGFYAVKFTARKLEAQRIKGGNTFLKYEIKFTTDLYDKNDPLRNGPGALVSSIVAVNEDGKVDGVHRKQHYHIRKSGHGGKFLIRTDLSQNHQEEEYVIGTSYQDAVRYHF